MAEHERPDVVAVLSQLPLPVAGAMRRALNAKSPLDRHHLAYFAAEAMLKIAASARIGTYLSSGPDPESSVLTRLDCLVQPSSGNWLELLRRLRDSLPEVVGTQQVATQPRNLTRARADWERTTRFIDAVLGEGILKKNVGHDAHREGALGFFAFLVAYRSEIIGRARQRSQAFYEQMGDLLLDALLDVLPDEALLGRLQLALRKESLSSQQTPAERGWLTLHGLARPPVSGQHSFPEGKEPPIPGQVYLVGGAVPVSLYPLVACAEGDSEPERVGVLDRVAMMAPRQDGAGQVQVERVDYLDYASGQSFSRVDALEGIAKLVSLARNTVVDQHALSVVVSEARDEALKSDVIDLAPGSIVGDFEIERELGRGGMGVVYRARQRSLDRAVALKLLLPAFSRDHDARARFLRDAQSQAAIEHRNVVRVYSFGEAEGRPHFAMELVTGGNLAETLEVTKKLQVERALVISGHVAEGLAAAWRNKIIHRDVKPSNIMFDNDGNALVADFGLAKPISKAETRNITVGKQLMGTPLYMSPEQAQGSDLDFHSDMYSLGIMLFEMLAGQRPFSGQTPYAVLEKQIHEPLPSLKALRPEVPDGVVRLVERMTAKATNSRPQSYEELSQTISSLHAPAALVPTVPPTAAVEAPVVGASTQGPQRGSPRKRRLLAGFGVAALLAVGAGIVAVSRKTPPVASTETSRTAGLARPRPSVSVIGFKNLGAPAASYVSNVLVENIRTELATDEKLRMVAGEDVARMKRELGIGDDDTLTNEVLSKVRRNLRVEYVVVGSYIIQGVPPTQRVDLNVRLLGTANGDSVTEFRDSGTPEDLFPLATRVGEKLRTRLGLGTISSEQTQSARAALPRDPEAGRDYAEGLAKLQGFDPQAAKAFLEEAAAREPKSAVIHAALSRAYGSLGFDLRAKAEAKRAADLAGGLPRQDALLIEAQLAETEGKWEDAARTYRALLSFFPDNLDYGLKLAAALTSGARPQEALETLQDLRRLPAPAGTDARLDVAEAAALQASTRYEDQLKIALTAVSKAQASSSRLVEGQAHLWEADALAHLGRLPEATRAGEQARTIFSEVGDLGSVARIEMIVAVAHAKAGDEEAAANGFEAALRAYRSVGDRKGTAKQLTNLGTILANREQYPEAIADYDEAAKVLGEIGSTLEEAKVVNNKGTVLSATGDWEGARRAYEQALEVFRKAKAERDIADALLNLGEYFQHQSRPIDAAERLSESVAISKRIGYKEAQAPATRKLAEVLRAQGRTDEAARLDAEAAELEHETNTDTK